MPGRPRRGYPLRCSDASWRLSLAVQGKGGEEKLLTLLTYAPARFEVEILAEKIPKSFAVIFDCMVLYTHVLKLSASSTGLRESGATHLLYN